MEFGGLTEPSMLKFSEESFKELFSRLDISKEHKKLFDQKYRESAGHIEAMFFKTKPTALENAYYATVLKNLKNVTMDMRPAVLADLIHMHINRLFASRQQLNEAECYYSLHKSLLKRKFKRVAVHG